MAWGLLNKKPISSFTINNPISYRNEVSMDASKWDEAVKSMSNGGAGYGNLISKIQSYSIAPEITEEAVPVSSTAIASARYDSNDNSLNIAYTSNPNKEYKFDAKDDLQQWMSASSKGRITNQWRKTHRMPGY